MVQTRGQARRLQQQQQQQQIQRQQPQQQPQQPAQPPQVQQPQQPQQQPQQRLQQQPPPQIAQQAPAARPAPHDKILKVSQRVIAWKKSKKNELRQQPPLLHSELSQLLVDLIDNMDTDGIWDKPNFDTGTKDGLKQTLELLEGEIHAVSNPSAKKRPRGAAGRKAVFLQKQLPAADKAAIKKAESKVAALIVLLDAAPTAHPVQVLPPVIQAPVSQPSQAPSSGQAQGGAQSSNSVQAQVVGQALGSEQPQGGVQAQSSGQAQDGGQSQRYGQAHPVQSGTSGPAGQSGTSGQPTALPSQNVAGAAAALPANIIDASALMGGAGAGPAGVLLRSSQPMFVSLAPPTSNIPGLAQAMSGTPTPSPGSLHGPATPKSSLFAPQQMPLRVFLLPPALSLAPAPVPVRAPAPAPGPGLAPALAPALAVSQMTAQQKSRRRVERRFEFFHKGDCEGWVGECDAPTDLANMDIPKAGTWPGLSMSLFEEKWRACKKNRRYFYTTRRVLRELPQGPSPGDDPSESTDLSALSLHGHVRAHNQTAMTPLETPNEDVKRLLANTAQLLRPTGLRYQRTLGQGGFGVAALFRVRKRTPTSSSTPQRPFHFVAKSSKDVVYQASEVNIPTGARPTEVNKALSEAKEKQADAAYLRDLAMKDLAKEKTRMKLFTGSRHIHQTLSVREIFQDLTRRNEVKVDPRPTRRASFCLDKNNNMLLTEFMSYGSLHDYLAKVCTKRLVLPNRALWRILSCLAHQLIGMKYPRQKLIKNPVDMVYESRHKLDTERVPHIDDAKNAVVHFDIDPQNILLDAYDEKHTKFPIFKISDFGLSEEAPNLRKLSNYNLHRKRVCGKVEYFGPEQFTTEWQHFPEDFPTSLDNSDPENWTAGNYTEAMNVYQMGQVMVTVIALQMPLFPPVPFLYCVRAEKKLPNADDDINLTDSYQRDYARGLEGLYDAKNLPSNPYDKECQDFRDFLMKDSNHYKRLKPQNMTPEQGIKLMPYSKAKGYGWLWTYATLILHKDTDENKNHPELQMKDAEMTECVALMMAHRSADRMDLKELRSIAKRNLNSEEAEPRGDGQQESDFKLESQQARDSHYYSDDSLQALTGLMHHGVPKFVSRHVTNDSVTPFPYAGSEILLPEPGDDVSARYSNRVSNWKPDKLAQRFSLARSQTPLPSNL